MYYRGNSFTTNYGINSYRIKILSPLIQGGIMARHKDTYPLGCKRATFSLDLVNEAILKQIMKDTNKSASYVMNAILEYYYSNVYDNSIYTNYTLGKPFSAGGKN